MIGLYGRAPSVQSVWLVRSLALFLSLSRVNNPFMHLLKQLNAALVFFLEIAMITGLGFGGYSFGTNTVTKWAFAIFFPVVAISLWAYFAAPKSSHRLELGPRIAFELLIFSLTAFVLYKSGYKYAGIAFAIISWVTVTASYFFEK